MKISIDAKSLLKQIIAIEKSCTATFINIEATKKGVFLSFTNGIVSTRLKVANSDVEEIGYCSVLISVISGVLKGRSILNLVVDNNKMNFSEPTDKNKTTKKGYSGYIETQEYQEVDFSITKDNFFTIDSDKVKLFNALSKLIILTGSFGTSTDMPVYIKITDTNTTFLCHDDYYLVQISSDKLAFSNDISFSILPSTLLSLLTITNDMEYNISIENNAINAWNNQFKYKHQLLQTIDAEEHLKNINTFLNADRFKTKSYKYTINRDKLKDIFSNFKSFQERGSPINFTVNNNTLSIMLHNSKGSITDTIELSDTDTKISGKNDISFLCEWELLNPLCDKLTQDIVELQCIDNRILLLKEEMPEYTILMTSTLAGD